MEFPKGKGFDITCGVVITVVLDTVVHDSLVRLTGTFLGGKEERRHHRHRRHRCIHESILIQLTCPFCERHGAEIPEGTIVAINVSEILFIVPGRKCHDKDDGKCHEKDHVINISCRNDDEYNGKK